MNSRHCIRYSLPVKFIDDTCISLNVPSENPLVESFPSAVGMKKKAAFQFFVVYFIAANISIAIFYPFINLAVVRSQKSYPVCLFREDLNPALIISACAATASMFSFVQYPNSAALELRA